MVCSLCIHTHTICEHPYLNELQGYCIVILMVVYYINKQIMLVMDNPYNIKEKFIVLIL